MFYDFMILKAHGYFILWWDFTLNWTTERFTPFSNSSSSTGTYTCSVSAKLLNKTNAGDPWSDRGQHRISLWLMLNFKDYVYKVL